MTKLKNTLVIFLAAVLVAAGAILPAAVSYFRDRSAAGKVQYGNMPSLQLSMTHESGLDLYEKLFLLSGELDALEIPAQEARMTTREVKAAAYAGIQTYLDMGFVGRIPEDYTFVCHPMLVYPVEDQEQYLVVWLVEMSLDAGNEYWGLIIDDETGSILIIEFNSEYISWQAEEYYEVSEAITATYIASLTFSDKEKVTTTTWDELVDEGHYVSKVLCIERNGDLPVYLQIEVYGGGFTVYVMTYGESNWEADAETMP